MSLPEWVTPEYIEKVKAARDAAIRRAQHAEARLKGTEAAEAETKALRRDRLLALLTGMPFAVPEPVRFQAGADGWSIHVGPSQWLLAEGPGWTASLGQALADAAGGEQ